MGHGIFGVGTRVMEGTVWKKDGNTPDKSEATAIANEIKHKTGAKVRVIPNPDREVYEVWVEIDKDPRHAGSPEPRSPKEGQLE